MTKRKLSVLKACCVAYPICVTVIVIGLAACATGQPNYIHVCPTMPYYTAAFERAAGQQLAALPANSPIVTMTEDYLKVRKEARDCK